MTARVIVYSRDACHLCEDAIAVVSAVCSELDEPWLLVDIDADDALKARFTDDVPVVQVDGRTVGFWRIKPQAVRAAVVAGRERPGRQ